MRRPRFLPDNFTLMLIASVALASLLPCRGQVAIDFNLLTNIAISLLFFLHGAKLSREAALAGFTHWRLHLMVLAATFAVFPLLGLLLKPVLGLLVTPALYLGVLYICVLPSTVQSSIAFTSVAHGNIPAAVCSASASSLIGIFITPILVGMMIMQHDGSAGYDAGHAVLQIVILLLIPFLAGQVLRRWIFSWIQRHPKLVKVVDQGSILLVVYTAFSEAVIEGLWHQLPIPALLGVLVICAILLAIMMLLTTYASRWLGFDKADEITIVFCGSKKSLASGIPMAKVLFLGHPIGLLVLPLMLFHQLQLMVCAVLAQRYAGRIKSDRTS
ncbi:bile acid:sodium symporter family protein [Aquirhabdus parva]|uniref:Bile acid:sodium symporter n=1 Tax=Aquirhabdus parva TaxID=2283318 RepID=A0A345PB29_9GAMM|nr:bile acid:sodium symporter family protein [Aquirhabdus parva]AXI04488.1 bile acid:sodium symporter [Aquirhabdus parva]